MKKVVFNPCEVLDGYYIFQPFAYQMYFDIFSQLNPEKTFNYHHTKVDDEYVYYLNGNIVDSNDLSELLLLNRECPALIELVEKTRGKCVQPRYMSTFDTNDTYLVIAEIPDVNYTIKSFDTGQEMKSERIVEIHREWSYKDGKVVVSS